MTMLMRAALSAALLAGAAAPAFAQDMPPPPPPPGEMGPGGPGMMGHGRMGPGKGMAGPGMGFLFRNLSPQGQQTMRDALSGLRDDPSREQVKAARDRQLEILGADRLDVAAMQRAMADERNLAGQAHARMQAALLSAYQKLSTADRQALVASAKQARDWMQSRREMRKEMRDYRQSRRPGTPPQPPQD